MKLLLDPDEAMLLIRIREQLKDSKYIDGAIRSMIRCYTLTARGNMIGLYISSLGGYRWIVHIIQEGDKVYQDYNKERNTKRTIDRYFNEYLMERIF